MGYGGGASIDSVRYSEAGGRPLGRKSIPVGKLDAFVYSAQIFRYRGWDSKVLICERDECEFKVLVGKSCAWTHAVGGDSTPRPLLGLALQHICFSAAHL